MKPTGPAGFRSREKKGIEKGKGGFQASASGTTPKSISFQKAGSNWILKFENVTINRQLYNAKIGMSYTHNSQRLDWVHTINQPTTNATIQLKRQSDKPAVTIFTAIHERILTHCKKSD